MDEHDLLVAVRKLADELGQTPTLAQFKKHIKNAQWALENSSFQKYSALVDSAGLAPSKQSRKIDNSVFEKDVEKHVQAHIPRPADAIQPYPTIATISDSHRPFILQRVVDRFLEFVGDVKPDYVIENGDSRDMYSHAKFPRSHNVFTPREEEALATEQHIWFWKEVQKRSPKSQCIEMLGNHDARPLKRILENYPEAEDWIQQHFQKLYTFPGVKTVFDPREELILPGDICVFHGYRSKLGDHRDYTLLNTLNGHTHAGGAVFRKIRGRILWELNSGLSGDPEAKGLTYTPQRITNWTNGFGSVDKLGPRFIPV